MYEYQLELNRIGTANLPCPPASARAAHVHAFRFVQNPVTAQCFLPVAVKHPPRLHAASGPSEQCACWGLSMYDSLQRALDAFNRLEQTVRKARARFGDHVAEAQLTPAHGVSTPPSSSSGHFTFHPHANAGLTATFGTLHRIP
jgi:hypothetical protein